MLHHLKIKDKNIAIDIQCGHPKFENNICPINCSNCDGCLYIAAIIIRGSNIQNLIDLQNK